MTVITWGHGGEFGRLWDAWNYLMGIVVLDDYTLRQVGDSNENTGWINVAGNYVDFNGYTILVECPLDDSHKGNQTKGFVVNIDASVGDIHVDMRDSDAANIGTLIIRNLRFFVVDDSNVIHLNIVSGRDTINKLNNIIFDGNGSGSANAINVWGVSGSVDIENVKIFGCNEAIRITDNGYLNGTFKFNNITVYNCRHGLTADDINTPRNEVFIFKNCVFANNAIDDYDLDGGVNPTIEYCADSDGTLPAGTGTRHNIIPANEFQSLDNTNDNFLKLTPGTAEANFGSNDRKGTAPHKVKFSGKPTFTAEGVLANNGVDVGLEKDISGIRMPNDAGFYDIGCHQIDYEWDT